MPKSIIEQTRMIEELDRLCIFSDFEKEWIKEKLADDLK